MTVASGLWIDLVAIMTAGELHLSWHGAHPRAVDLGWIYSWRRRSSARRLLGIHHSNGRKQAEKVQESTGRSDKVFMTVVVDM